MPQDTTGEIPQAVARRQRRLTRAEREQAGITIDAFGGFDVAYRLDTADEDVIDHSFEKDIFLAAMPDYVVPRDGIILDVGAHIGTFSLLAARMAPAGRVLAVEASRETCDLLRVNVALNRCSNISVHHAALAGSDGTVQLHHDAGGNWGHTIMQAMSDFSEEVRAISLETLVATEKVAHIDLAKFNCEGAEFPILLGASDALLRRFRNLIVLFHADLTDGHTAAELLARFANLGFKTETRDVWGDNDARGWILATQV